MCEETNMTGLEFESKTELELFIKKIQINFRLSKYNTRLYKENEKLFYHSLTYKCECAGEYISRSKNIRVPKSSMKCGCPFVIYVKLTKDKSKLKISEKSIFVHNEACQEKHKVSEIEQNHDAKEKSPKEKSAVTKMDKGEPTRIIADSEIEEIRGIISSQHGGTDVLDLSTHILEDFQQRSIDTNLNEEAKGENSAKLDLSADLFEEFVEFQQPSDMSSEKKTGHKKLDREPLDVNISPNIYQDSQSKISLLLNLNDEAKGENPAKLDLSDDLFEEFVDFQQPSDTSSEKTTAHKKHDGEPLDINISPNIYQDSQSKKSLHLRNKKKLDNEQVEDNLHEECSLGTLNKSQQPRLPLDLGNKKQIVVKNTLDALMDNFSTSLSNELQQSKHLPVSYDNEKAVKEKLVLKNYLASSSLGIVNDSQLCIKETDDSSTENDLFINIGDVLLTNSVKKTTDNCAGNLSSQFTHLRVQNLNKLDDIVFVDDKKKSRGRPIGSIKKKVGGAPYVSPLQPYAQKTANSRVKLLLHQLTNDLNIVYNIIERSYTLKKSDLIKVNEENLKDTFLDVKVDVINTLKHYATDACLHYLMTIIKKKRSKNIYTCYICCTKAEIDVVQCDSCLQWLHFHCVNIEDPDTIDDIEPWYCDSCQNLYHN